MYTIVKWPFLSSEQERKKKSVNFHFRKLYSIGYHKEKETSDLNSLWLKCKNASIHVGSQLLFRLVLREKRKKSRGLFFLFFTWHLLCAVIAGLSDYCFDSVIAGRLRCLTPSSSTGSKMSQVNVDILDNQQTFETSSTSSWWCHIVRQRPVSGTKLSRRFTCNWRSVTLPYDYTSVSVDYLSKRGNLQVVREWWGGKKKQQTNWWFSLSFSIYKWGFVVR